MLENMKNRMVSARGSKVLNRSAEDHDVAFGRFALSLLRDEEKTLHDRSQKMAVHRGMNGEESHAQSGKAD
jgi:hypothetical protein